MNEMSAAREEKGRAWCTGWFSQHVAGRKGVENEERREKCSKKAEGRVDDSCTEQDGQELRTLIRLLLIDKEEEMLPLWGCRRQSLQRIQRI